VELFDIKTIAAIAQAVAIIFGGALFLLRLAKSVGSLEALLTAQSAEIKDLKNETKKLGDILTKIAVQDERINFAMKRIDELAHWGGFVGPPPWSNTSPVRLPRP